MLEYNETLPDDDIPMPPGRKMRLSFGNLILEVSHQPFEWSLSYLYWRTVSGSDLVEYGPETKLRYVFGNSTHTLSFTPRLADRPVVSRPVSPISIMPGARTYIYVSTPLWLSISIAGQELIELPVVRLSDTWFGERTGAGELCYSDSTRARLDPLSIENLYYKAVTPILIKNYSSKQLVLDRINVPVPVLALYRSRDRDKSYNTDSITVTLNSAEERMKIELSATQDHSDEDLVHAARKPQRRQFLSRAMDLFLS